MIAFYRHDYERAGSKAGPWTEPDLPPLGFDSHEMVGIIFDAEDGLGFYRGFDVAQLQPGAGPRVQWGGSRLAASIALGVGRPIASGTYSRGTPNASAQCRRQESRRAVRRRARLAVARRRRSASLRAAASPCSHGGVRRDNPATNSADQ